MKPLRKHRLTEEGEFWLALVLVLIGAVAVGVALWTYDIRLPVIFAGLCLMVLGGSPGRTR